MKGAGWGVHIKPFRYASLAFLISANIISSTPSCSTCSVSITGTVTGTLAYGGAGGNCMSWRSGAAEGTDRSSTGCVLTTTASFTTTTSFSSSSGSSGGRSSRGRLLTSLIATTSVVAMVTRRSSSSRGRRRRRRRSCSRVSTSVSMEGTASRMSVYRACARGGGTGVKGVIS